MSLVPTFKGLLMSAHLTCRLDHHWHLALDDPEPTTPYSLLCPLCGEGAVGLSWEAARPPAEAATLLPPPNGVQPSEAETLPPSRDEAEEPELLPEEPDALDSEQPDVPG